MPVHKFVKAAILVNGKPLDEYTDNDEPVSEDGNIIRYVEAVSGQAFVIRAGFERGFDPRSAPWLAISVSFPGWDGESFDWKLPPRERIALLKPRARKWATMTISDENDKLVQKPFIFETLKISTSNKPSKGHNTEKKSGIIFVKAWRLNSVEQSASTEGAKCSTTQMVTQKEFDGMGIHLGISSQNPGTPVSVDLATAEWEYIEGEDGEPIIFEFRYRTRKALQDIGLIPADNELPNPLTLLKEPTNSAVLERMEHMEAMMKLIHDESRQAAERERRAMEENSQLRNRLEAIGESVGLSPRKRGIDEVDTDEVTAVQGPVKPPPEIIELSDDDD